jgi:hypothetical protein
VNLADFGYAVYAVLTDFLLRKILKLFDFERT